MADYISHIIDLRTRVLRTLCVISFVFMGFFLFSERLYTSFAQPLLKQLPAGDSLIATTVTATFMVPTKLAFMLALFAVMPYILYQGWGFIAPGLYHHEQRKIVPLLLSSCGLFYLGMAFSFWVICPLALGFFANAAPQGVKVMTDIEHYLDFVLNLLFSGGLAFQIPVITFIAITANWISIEKLTACRPYVIVAAFILGMLLTPPDVVSQILLALPMWGLFEIGLIFARHSSKKQPL